MDTILYQYEQIEEAISAIKKAAENTESETSGLAQNTRNLFGSEWVGAAATAYDETSSKLQTDLRAKIEYMGELHKGVQAAIDRMKAQDSSGAGQMRG